MTAYRTIESSSTGDLVGVSWNSPHLAALLAVAVATTVGWGAPIIPRAGEASARLNIHDGASHASSLITYDTLAVHSRVIREQLLKLGSLPDNWDGMGALAPEAANLMRIVGLVESLPVHLATYKSMIGGDGEIGVYWANGTRFADLSVDSDGEALLYLRELNQANGRLFEVKGSQGIGGELIREIEVHLA